MIRTGATRRAIAPAYDPILGAAVDAVADRGALYVYGSVATGTAGAPTSDVDLLSIGLPRLEAAQISADLSVRFQDRCREVRIGPATWEDLEADTDEGYGLRVFLRHYCAHLSGADPAGDLPDHRRMHGWPGGSTATSHGTGRVGGGNWRRVWTLLDWAPWRATSHRTVGSRPKVLTTPAPGLASRRTLA